MILSRFLFRLLIVTLALSNFVAYATQPEVLIKWRQHTSTPGLRAAASRQAAQRLGAEIRRLVGKTGWDVAALPEGTNLRAWLEHARNDPNIAHVELNRRYYAFATVNDRLFPRLYGLTQIGAPAAWDTTTGNSNVVIAVLDTGINLAHPDLAPVLWTNTGEIPNNGLDDDNNGIVDDVHGADFVDNDGDPTDEVGHGSHVAGIIAGAGNNQIGVAGVAYGCRILPIRILSADGGALTSDIVRAFEYVRDLKLQGVNVRLINNSWGGDFPSLSIFEAISDCADNGILSICAAGNDFRDTDLHPAYPAAYNSHGVLSVAASDSCDLDASFSNYGRRTVHLAAPGAGIYSPWGRGHDYFIASGTSMAAPHVSGAAALLLSRQPSLTLAQLRAVLLTQTDLRPAWTNRTATGARVNVSKAMTFLNGGSPVPTNDPPNSALTNTTRRIINKTRTGGPTRDVSFSGQLGSTVSENGRYVVYLSYETNIVTGDVGDFLDVFIRDTVSNTNGRVSQTLAGVGANGDCDNPIISRDGNYVAFVSTANNLIGDDFDTARDVFVWNRTTRAISLASFDPQDFHFDLDADSPSISDDGGFVAFAAETDLGGGTVIRDIYVWRRALDSTQIINFKSPSTFANDWSDYPSISGDGRFVTYHTWADNLVTPDANPGADIHVYDRTGVTTVRISRNAANQQANNDCLYPIISGDGNYIAFLSYASNLGQLPNNGTPQNYLVHRTTAAQFSQISLDAKGQPLTATNFTFDVNHDGRFVMLNTDSDQLPPFYGYRSDRPFIYDRLTRFLNVVALNDGGFPGDDNSFYPAISATGEYVVFSSWANNLVAPDGNNLLDVVQWRRGTQLGDLRIRPTGQTNWTGTGIIHPLTPQRVYASAETNGISRAEAQLFNSGIAVTTFTLRAIITSGWQFTAATTNNVDVTAAVLAGTQSSGALAVGASYFLRLSLNRTNGNAEPLGEVRLIARVSGGTTDLDAVKAVATRTLSPAGLRLVSRGTNGEPGFLGGFGATFDTNGQQVTFASASDNLTALDENFAEDIFVATPNTGELRLASTASDGTPGNSRSLNPHFARTGNKLAFESDADNLVPGDLNEVADVFVKDLQADTTERVSLSEFGNPLSRGSQSPILSADGRFVLFESIAPDVIAGDTNACMDIFLRDRMTGSVQCISRNGLGQWANADSIALAMTPDARYILFASHASNLSPTDTNQFPDIYLRDRTLNQLELITGRNVFETSDGHAVAGSISDNGQFVAFRMDGATTFPAGTNGTFLLDRSTGIHTSITPQNFGLPANSRIRNAQISPNGSALALIASDECGSTNTATQIWLAPRTGGAARPLSSLRTGTRGTRDSFGAVFSGSSERMAFASAATNLVNEFWPQAEQLFIDDTAIVFPDMALGRTAQGSWRGTAEVGTNQTTIEQPLALNTPRDIYLRVTDFSGFGGAVVVTGPVGNGTSWSVRYFSDSDGGTEVTGSMAAGWTFNPGANALDLRMRVRVTILTTNAPASFTINVRSLAYPTLQENILVLLVQDFDNDGLADTWERGLFNNLTTASLTTDFDGDGMKDSQEYVAGTDPKSAASVLRLNLLSLQNGANFGLTSTHTNRFYRLEATPTIGTGFSIRTMEQRGNGGTLPLRDSAFVSPTNGLYRARAELP